MADTPYQAYSAEQQDALSALNEVLSGVAQRSQSFANDLVKKGQTRRLSSKQMYWVVRLTKEATPSDDEAVIEAVEESGQSGAISRLHQAVPYLQGRDRNFASDLVRKGNKWTLSEKQMYWVNTLAEKGEQAKAEGQKTQAERQAEYEARRLERIARQEAERIATTPVSDEDADSGWEAVMELFDTGAETLSRMKINLITEDDTRVVVRSARRKGESNDVIHVHQHNHEKNDRRARFGHITKATALWNMTPATPQNVREVMEQFKNDPVGTVAEMGRKSGVCCFCSLPLTDERSTAHGYGPICAKNYSLEWGTVSARNIEQNNNDRVNEVVIDATFDTFHVKDAETGDILATFSSRSEAQSWADEFTTVEWE